MTAVPFTTFVFIATFGAAMLGFAAQRFLPRTYADESTAGSVKVVLGMISVLTTVVFGFITADAKKSFDNAAKIITDTAVRLVSIDRALADFGADAVQIRGEIKQVAEGLITRVNSPEGYVPSARRMVERGEELEDLVGKIARLTPQSEMQAKEQARAMELAAGILHDRWVLATERAASSPTVFLLIVLAWLALQFLAFGLFASRNVFVVLATVLASLTVASGMFVVLDLEGPMTGPMRVSTRALEWAVAIMGQ
ncbi:MAG: hypothetical protein ACKOYJ_09630 [Planctomycetia bacterium]